MILSRSPLKLWLPPNFKCIQMLIWPTLWASFSEAQASDNKQFGTFTGVTSVTMCDSACATWSMETGEIGSLLLTNAAKRFSQLNAYGTMLAWTPLHNTCMFTMLCTAGGLLCAKLLSRNEKACSLSEERLKNFCREDWMYRHLTVVLPSTLHSTPTVGTKSRILSGSQSPSNMIPSVLPTV